jgi:hypothetical protein
VSHDQLGELKPDAIGSTQLQAQSITDVHLAAGAGIAQAKIAGLTSSLDTKVAKGELVFNVKDYGALGNGSTDDTTAIQATIAAANVSGGVVFMPAGTYMTTGISLNGVSRVTIQGAGPHNTTIKLMNNINITTGTINATTNGSYCILRDFGVHGNRVNNTGHADGIRFPSSATTGVVLENLYVQEADARGINVTGTEFMITRCYVESCSQAGIGLNTNANRGRVLFNICTLNTGDGIYIGSRDVVAMGNKCFSNHDTGMNFGGAEEPTGWNQIIGNEVWLNWNSGLNTGGGDNSIIQGNIAYANGRNQNTPRSNAGIRIRDTTGYDPNTGINFAANHTIVSGNRCYDDTSVDPLPGTSLGQLYGIEIVNVTAPSTTIDPDNIVIIGNDLEGNLSAAVRQAGVGSDLKIVGNLGVSDNGGGSGSGSGLLGIVSYNPGAITSLQTSSATFVDADATNLKVTFTAPSSGQVLVRLTAGRTLSGTTPVQYWNIRTGGADIAGTEGVMSASTTRSRNSHSAVISGLTAGVAYTYTWGHRVTGTAATSTISTGSTDGPAVIEVWSA